jgi:hypothetical protein
MAKGSLRLCKDCKFCLRLVDYEPESYSLFCDNVSTKEMDPPIGFLSQKEKGCEFFEEAQEESVGLQPEETCSLAGP